MGAGGPQHRRRIPSYEDQVDGDEADWEVDVCIGRRSRDVEQDESPVLEDVFRREHACFASGEQNEILLAKKQRE